jgi:hypothetical protein
MSNILGWVLQIKLESGPVVLNRVLCTLWVPLVCGSDVINSNVLLESLVSRNCFGLHYSCPYRLPIVGTLRETGQVFSPFVEV